MSDPCSPSHRVLASDALRTPQLLWTSGIRLPAVGRYLNDQPQIISAVYLNDVTDTDRHTDAATPPLTDARGSLTGVCWVPFTDAHPFHVQVIQMDALPIQVGQGNPARRQTDLRSRIFVRQDRAGTDRVELSETDTDAYGMPALKIHYRLDETDLAAISAAEASLRNVADQLGEFVTGGEPKTLAASSSLHY